MAEGEEALPVDGAGGRAWVSDVPRRQPSGAIPMLGCGTWDGMRCGECASSEIQTVGME